MSERTMTTELAPDVIEAHEQSLKLALGVGCKRDLAAAITPMRKAAEGGHPQAQCNLGFLYATGDAIGRNLPEAIRWLTAAAEQGEGQAMFSLVQIAEAGRLSPISVGGFSPLITEFAN